MSESIAQVLRSKGISEEQIQTFLALAGDAPQLAAAAEASIPGSETSLYRQAQAQYPDAVASATSPIPEGGGLMAAFSYVPKGNEYAVGGETGAITYKSGVIADPATESVFFPPNDPTVAGSPAWLRKVQDDWSDEKIEKWRRKLSVAGYQVDPSGGYAKDLKDALEEYHHYRYLNYGKPMKLRDGVQEARVRDVYDPVETRADIANVLQTVFQDEPTEAEVEQFMPAVHKAVKRALRNGKTPEAARLRGEEALADSVLDDPATEKWMELEEGSTAMHDSFVNLFSVLKAMGS